MAQCPAHDDRTPSLHVSTDDDGNVGVHCHAECFPEVILDALGLRFPDLFVNFGASFPKPETAASGPERYKGQGARDKDQGPRALT